MSAVMLQAPVRNVGKWGRASDWEPTQSMLVWGAVVVENKSVGDSADVNLDDHSFIHDVFARVGGPNDPTVDEARADILVQINADDVVMDNVWLWRADHDVTGLVKNGEPLRHRA